MIMPDGVKKTTYLEGLGTDATSGTVIDVSNLVACDTPNATVDPPIVIVANSNRL